MAELRYDPVTAKWTVISKLRGQHRDTFINIDNNKPCPFCDKDGGINKNLRAISQINLPDSDAPALIVTPNKYPALGIEGTLSREGHGLYDQMEGIGAHEIIIDSFKHGIDISGYTEEEIANLYTAFKWRITDLEKDSRFKYITAFKNIGELAGEVIHHPHAQVIALPVIPANVKTAIRNSVEYYKTKERCLYCDIIKQEKHEKSRIVFENYEFIAFTPYASSNPFEISIYPKKHDSNFRSISDGTIRQLADITKEIFSRLDCLLHKPSLTLALRIAPFKNNRTDHENLLSYLNEAFHWHIDIRPIVTKHSTDIWATDISLNPVSPEDAAAHLREVKKA